MEKTRKIPGLLILLLLLFLPAKAFGEIEIIAPTLDFIDSISFQTETMINQNLQYAADDLENMVEPLVHRPRFTSTISQAQLLGAALSLQSGGSHGDSVYLGIGITGSFISPTFNPEELESYLGDLVPEDDPPLGGGVQLLRLEGGTPAHRWLAGLGFHGSLGYVKVEYENIQLTTGEFMLGAGYHPFRERTWKKNLQWIPLYLQCGVGGRILQGEVEIPLDQVEQQFPLDPDGSGPLPSQQVTLQITPEVRGALESYGVSIPLQISTGFCFLGSTYLQIGAGGMLGFSGTSIKVNGRGTIVPLGYLGDLIEDPGELIVRGDFQGESGQLFTTYLWTSLTFDLGNIYLNIPLLFQPSQGVAGGINLGVSL